MKSTLIKENPYLSVYGDGKEIYASFELKKYANINTLSVLMDGKQIFPYRFTLLGCPCFSLDVYHEYEKLSKEYRQKTGEKYGYFTVDVEYEEEEFNVPLESFNTIEGITKSLVDLETFNEMLDNRRIYRKVHPNSRLDEFVVYGQWVLDLFGQVMTITEVNYNLIPESNSPELKEYCNLFGDKVVTEKYFGSFFETFSISYAGVPRSDSVCKICDEDWSIENLKYANYSNYIYKFINGETYHKKCYCNDRHDKEIIEFKEIFARVYPGSDLQFDEIPNGYCSRECCKHLPWFIYHTPDGDIRLGWRKRVISIEWLENYKIFSHSFQAEDVTKGFSKSEDYSRYIHAWGKEKAIEYLLAAKNSIL